MAGEILRTLDKLKLRENTLVILSSDNGPVINDGYFDDSENLLGAHKPARPFRGGNVRLTKAARGCRFSCAVVRLPGQIKRSVSDAMLSQMNLLASLADLTGQTLNHQSATNM